MNNNSMWPIIIFTLMGLIGGIVIGKQNTSTKLTIQEIQNIRDERSKRCVIPKACIMMSDAKLRDNCISETVYCE